MSKRGRKRKLETTAFSDSSSDDNTNSHNTNSHPSKKRVKFDQSVNADSSNDKYNKYESSSINLPKLSNYLKVRVGDEDNQKDICMENVNKHNKNGKQLWLFHFPPGFDETSINNLKLSIPVRSKNGERIETFRIKKRRFQIMEYDCSQNNIATAFAVNHKLKLGKPFQRHFHILPDLRPSPNKKRNKDMTNVHSSEDLLLFGDILIETEKEIKSEPIIEVVSKKLKKKKKKRKEKEKEKSQSVLSEEVLDCTNESKKKHKKKRKGKTKKKVKTVPVKTKSKKKKKSKKSKKSKKKSE